MLNSTVCVCKTISSALLIVHVSDDFDTLSTMTSGTIRKKWTEDETDEFIDAVKIFGVGNWAKIKEYLGTERTNVMLKDKWRNIVEAKKAQELKALKWKEADKLKKS